MTHDDVTGGGPFRTCRQRDGQKVDAIAVRCQPGPAHNQRAWQRADERPGTRACSPAAICVLWRQGLCRAWGVGPCLYGVVAGQGAATSTWGINKRDLEIRLTSILKPIFPVTALLRPSGRCQFNRFAGALAGTEV